MPGAERVADDLMSAKSHSLEGPVDYSRQIIVLIIGEHVTRCLTQLTVLYWNITVKGRLDKARISEWHRSRPPLFFFLSHHYQFLAILGPFSVRVDAYNLTCRLNKSTARLEAVIPGYALFPGEDAQHRWGHLHRRHSRQYDSLHLLNIVYLAPTDSVSPVTRVV